MKKTTFSVIALLALSFLAVSTALAWPTLPQNQGTVIAGDKSPAISGTEVVPPQPQESELTKIYFIRYAPGKEPLCNNNGTCDPKENWKSCPNDCQKGGGGGEDPAPTACYTFLSGAKPTWPAPENYYYNDLGLGAASNFAVTTWNLATTNTIFGVGLVGAGPWGTYDQKNSIVYGDYSDPNVIGVTAVWYRSKTIYEYDIMFDTDYFPSANYDLDTVVLHEFGHAAGLGDLYDGQCSTEVMYGYYHGVDLDLGTGDLFGIQTLYGI